MKKEFKGHKVTLTHPFTKDETVITLPNREAVETYISRVENYLATNQSYYVSCESLAIRGYVHGKKSVSGN